MDAESVVNPGLEECERPQNAQDVDREYRKDAVHRLERIHPCEDVEYALELQDAVAYSNSRIFIRINSVLCVLSNLLLKRLVFLTLLLILIILFTLHYRKS